MALGPRLDLRQSQSLVMTPQLQQAIKLLALSNQELEHAIADEVERNPLLDTGTEDDARDAGPADDDRPDHEEAPEPETSDRLLEHGGEGDAPLDVDYTAETFHHDSAADSGSGLSSPSEEGFDFDRVAAPDLSLHDHLIAQAGTVLSETDLLIAGHLIDQIDEAGYLQASLLETAQRLELPRSRLERVLGIIQGFDPTGVGARSLSECIALQAKEADRFDPAMARLIENLDLLAAGRIAQLKRMCGVDDEDMADMIRELRGYDPKPGLRFGGNRTETVVPDLFVREGKAGWIIEINSSTLPRVLVNRTYYAELSAGPQDKASRTWLAECMASANWLVRALDQRQRTIIKVASEIVKQQEGFFRNGIAHLRPLTLRAVADAIGMHESTVSRVTSNKYLSCDRGLFELKFFFTSSIAAADGGEAVSAEAVKEAIRTLILGESAEAILSDDTLVELLNSKGFDIARRTVAKYREAMGIGSSVQRRRQRAIARAA